MSSPFVDDSGTTFGRITLFHMMPHMSNNLNVLFANPMTRESYLSWTNQMEDVLCDHKFLPFVKGTIVVPPKMLKDGHRNPNYEENVEIDEMVLSWIKATGALLN